MTERVPPELPPQSRISSRAGEDELTIVIPSAARNQIFGGWTVAFAFLAVTFAAQGFLTHDNFWSAGGFFFLLLTVWKTVAGLGSSLRTSQQTHLQITSETLAMISGSAEVPARREWPRSAVKSICAKQTSLFLQLTNEQPPVRLLSGLQQAELDWIAEQLRMKWGI